MPGAAFLIRKANKAVDHAFRVRMLEVDLELVAFLIHNNAIAEFVMEDALSNRDIAARL